MSEAKKFNPAWLLAVLVPLFIIIGVSVFLNSKDCDTCLTGWATLKLEWPSFWVWAVIGIVVGIACVVWAIKNETSGSGGTGKTIFLIILAIAFIAGPWGKACTDKANQGVTAPGYKVGAK